MTGIFGPRAARLALAGVALATMGGAANATTYVWTVGFYNTGVTSPNPLLAGDTLSIEGTTTKTFSTGFTNHTGTVDWLGGSITLQGSTATVVNRSLWRITSDRTISSSGGEFSNTGTLQKAGGEGITTFNTTFNNSGTIDAQTGRISFLRAASTFNAGTVFTGGGVVSVSGPSTFKGSFTSSNLVLSGGATGEAAVANGTVQWLSGSLRGGWEIASGATLNLTGTTKAFDSASFANNGTVNWSESNVIIRGSSVVNNGVIAITNDVGLSAQGINNSFVNNGIIAKTGGAGAMLIEQGAGFDNNGTLSVTSGTILFQFRFINDGTMTGTGTFSMQDLTNNGTIAPGANGAVGTLDVTGNYLQSASGIFAAQIGGSGMADLFRVSGTAALGGTLALSCIGGCTIANGDVFTLLDSVGDLSGMFGSVTTDGFLQGFRYALAYDTLADRVQLTVLDVGGVPEPSTWAMMLAGFGAVGAAVRRRPANRSVLA